jgi:hypothetical protein
LRIVWSFEETADENYGSLSDTSIAGIGVSALALTQQRVAPLTDFPNIGSVFEWNILSRLLVVTILISVLSRNSFLTSNSTELLFDDLLHFPKIHLSDLCVWFW